MPRGYRCIFVAVLGCLIAAAPLEPEQNAKADKQHSGGHRQSAVAASPLPALKPVQPPKYQAPCRNPQDSNACNLEAAWEQAQGSRDSAKWALWQVVLAAIGSVAVIVSLAYTRRAVKIAGEATRDADKALEIAERGAKATADLVGTARENARRETKAYVGISCIQLFVPTSYGSNTDRDPLRYELIVSVMNYGKTPARIVRLRYGTIIERPTRPGEYPFGDVPNSAGCDLSPNASFNVYIPLSVSRLDHEAIIAGERCIFLHTLLSFEDVFDGGSMTKNSFWSSGDAYIDGRMTSVLSGTTV